jgi:hypothetical protein
MDFATETKRCCTCKTNRPIDEFYFARKALGERHARCKRCWKDKSRGSEKPQTYRRSVRDRTVEGSLRRKYGLTVDRYTTMFFDQGGACAICGEKETYGNKTGQRRILSVDHDHTTGKVRGLLCNKCNQALGLLRDRPDLALRAAEYLAEHQNTVTQEHENTNR